MKSVRELEKLLKNQKPETRLRAAQSILVQFRWWWRETHPRPRRAFARGPKRPKRPKDGGDGIFTEEELQRQAEVRERDRRTLSVDRLMIFENGSDRPGGGSPRVEFFPKGDWFIKWWKVDEEAEQYIKEMLKPPAEKPCPIVGWRFRDGKAIYWPQGDTDNWPPLTRDYAPPVSSGPEPEVSGPPARAGPEEN